MNMFLAICFQAFVFNFETNNLIFNSVYRNCASPTGKGSVGNSGFLRVSDAVPACINDSYILMLLEDDELLVCQLPCRLCHKQLKRPLAQMH